MTDEQRPWREYSTLTSLRIAIRFCDKRVQDEIERIVEEHSARVWREAEDGVKGVLAVSRQVEKQESDRADAAEAQRDRLAAALTRLHDAIDDFNAGSEKDDDERQHLCWLCGASTYGGDGVIHEPHCAILVSRAALADVRPRGRSDAQACRFRLSGSRARNTGILLARE